MSDDEGCWICGDEPGDTLYKLISRTGVGDEFTFCSLDCLEAFDA